MSRHINFKKCSTGPKNSHRHCNQNNERGTSKKTSPHINRKIARGLAITTIALGFQSFSNPASATNNDYTNDSKAVKKSEFAPLTGPDFDKFDGFMEQGLLVKMPPNRDTILKDAWGLRSQLAEHNIGLQILSLNNLTYDLNSPSYHGDQTYNGEDLTGMSTEQVLLTYNFDQEGIDQKQLIFAMVNTVTNWQPQGPRATASLSRLAYYQSFNQKQWEMKVGYLSNALEYVGIYTGGSLVGGTQGINSVIPFQVGLSRLPFSSPGINLKFNADNGFYNKLGAQRSMSPHGPEAEIDNNEHGFRWQTPGAGTLFIDEIGLQKSPTQDTRYMWLRAGAIHNSSDYDLMNGQGKSNDNYAYYLAADVQLTPPGNTQSHGQGWILGGSYNYAPSDRNLYTEYLEARLYKRGIIPSRPFDMLSFNINRTKFSPEARHAYAANSIDTAHHSDAATVSYMARIYSGAYLSTALSHVSSPSFAPEKDDALNLSLSLNLFF
ncbi:MULTISPECIES: carbohydrate porin [unclassified Modicisalibacter]|uniref:carbohydrate porin n=1 Tax=unclassified Modicisalibacter TaxID=2679913 RepID=UPI001CCE6471|nr:MULTISPECIES: carbohydrate porin [unclassified Modicisalibacter]MBZ9559495.1 carbohydrate porin [Modicisalibacter sp. R2A 31.J]MBZ9576947.1 carbohydrate porin [Modicisalibacter sp. MOD 31.J]